MLPRALRFKRPLHHCNVLRPCEVSAGTPGSTGKNEMVEHQGIAPCIPVWKTGVYLSTPMLEKIGLPTVARHNEEGARLRSSSYGGQPSPHCVQRRFESRNGVAPFCTVLQTAAWAARPTGLSNGEWGMQDAESRAQTCRRLTAVCSTENNWTDDDGLYRGGSVPSAVLIILATVVWTFPG